jgi:hypothetical protein
VYAYLSDKYVYTNGRTRGMFFSKKISVNRVYVQLNHLFSQINCTNWLFCCVKVVQRLIKLRNKNEKLICVSVKLVSV